ncbi:TPA: amidohydrolase [Candidatus Poribacteria bacterium]|nr:amidohydrolase [Candidatus Poribacteria bacterium]
MNDLRQGRLDIVPHYFKVDLPFYKEHLKDFLPDKIIDIHSHSSNNPGLQPGDPMPTFWADWVTFGHGMLVPKLLEAYLQLFPGKEVFPVCFPISDRKDVDERNKYLAEELERYDNIWGLIWTMPDWTEDELIKRMKSGRFSGIKPYPSMVKDAIPDKDITIFDYLPHHHLKLAEKYGWIVMLHIARPDRLADPVNISQLREISKRYPKIKLIIAHIGRSYCPRHGLIGIPALKDCENLLFDISANTNQPVMELLIREVGTKRILFGSDMPITAMRAKRICEGDEYINYVWKADWTDNRTRRNIEEEDTYTFLLYEQILSFKNASMACSLTKADIEDVFFNNAYNLFTAGA